MTIETSKVVVGGIPIKIVRKPIKNLHLGVYPPNGRVRVAAPIRINDNAVRLAVVQRLRWIKSQQARFQSQIRESEREMVTGESHYVWGKRYRLRVIREKNVRGVRLRNQSRLELFVPPRADVTQRRRILQQWYRNQLRELVPPLLAKWQSIFGVQCVRLADQTHENEMGSMQYRSAAYLDQSGTRKEAGSMSRICDRP